jgi:hypothetical protein
MSYADGTIFRHSKSTVTYVLIGGRQHTVCILKTSSCKLVLRNVKYFCYLY